MPRRYFNDGQEIVESDLAAISASLEIELYDRLIYEMLNRQQSFLFGDSLLCSNVNATTSQVAAGTGFYYDSTQVDPEPNNRMLHKSVAANSTHDAADATYNRYDIIVVTPARATLASATRNFKDASSGVVSSQSMVVETDWIPTISIVKGTAAASPVVPSTPAGSIKLAEVLVTAVTGISGAGAYTDKRPRYHKPSSWKTKKSVTSTQTIDKDDELIIANANGGAIILTLPAASECEGKEIMVVKADSSANTVTVAGAGSDLIIGSATQVMSVQYTSLVMACDGTSWYLK